MLMLTLVDYVYSKCVRLARGLHMGQSFHFSVYKTETNHTLCAEPKIALNCAMKPGPHNTHRDGINSARQPWFFLPIFENRLWEYLWASVWVCVHGGEGVCVQEIKHSSAPQPAAGGLLEAGKGTSSPGLPTPPRALWETNSFKKAGGGLSFLSSVKSMDCQFNLSQLFVFLREHEKSGWRCTTICVCLRHINRK